MILPETMRFIDAVRPGGPEVLQLSSGPLPAVRDGEVLIRVQAAGVNRVDCQQRSGTYAPPPGASNVLGVEVAGEVVATGDGVATFHIGNRVCALVDSGGYAEYCAAPARQCLPWPSRYDAVQAAALPETYFTVWANLFSTGCLKPGETLLVHGGTSGIGTTAIQLARERGVRVFATAGSAEKCAACVRLGAEAAINYKIEDFVARIRELTAKRGVDVVLDIVGGDYLQRNIDCLAMHGRLLQVGLIGGAKAQINLNPILQRRLTLTGSTLRPRSAEEKGALARELEAHVWPLLEAGTVRPVVSKTFPLEEAAEAHRLLEAGQVIGKLVLEV